MAYKYNVFTNNFDIVEDTSGFLTDIAITTDSGTATWTSTGSLLGTGRATTSGSGSTATINVPDDRMVWTDQGSSTSVLANSGSFVTASITLTLPASPAQGDRCEFVTIGAFTLIIDAPGTQLIKLGTVSSSAGGTCTSSALGGDSIVLVYRAANTTWECISAPQGIWTLA